MSHPDILVQMGEEKEDMEVKDRMRNRTVHDRMVQSSIAQ